MSSHHEDVYTEREQGADGGVQEDAGEARSAVSLVGDDEELNITCRTGSLLPAEPDIVSGKVLAVQGTRSAVLDLRFGPKVSFNPGVAPQACAISPDDAQLLPARYVNLAGASRLAQLVGRAVFQLHLQDGNRPATFAFRLKFEEMRFQPRRAVILATVDLRTRLVTLARG